MTPNDTFLQEVANLTRSAHEQTWAHLCTRLLTDYELTLSPESYRSVAQRLEREVLPQMPEVLQRETRELIRSLIQDAQYFSWLQQTFGADWKTWRNQGHHQLGDLRQRFERERCLVRSPYVYAYWEAYERAPAPPGDTP